MHTLRLTVAYDGSSFLGWQKTKMGPSIEESLEKALSILLRHPVKLQAASRTDAGVHAERQVVSAQTPNLPDLFRLQRGLQGLLPPEISLIDLALAPSNFHPTLDCIGKEYRYDLCNSFIQLPFYKHTSWHIKTSLDILKMKQAALSLIGMHDFSAFTSEKKENNVREIYAISVELLPFERLQIVVKGNSFLYKMVRTIVGTLVDVGRGKIKVEEIINIIQKKERSCAGITAPAHGLSLARVFYP